MINKLATLAIRIGVTLLIAVIASIPFNVSEFNRSGSEVSAFLVGFLIFFIGIIYSLFKFNDHYSFGVASKAESKINEAIDKKKKLQTEEEMLRVKNLFDQGILTKEEYDQKMDNLKEKYL